MKFIGLIFKIILSAQYCWAQNSLDMPAPNRNLERPQPVHSDGVDMELADSRYSERVEAEILTFAHAPPGQGLAKIHELVDFAAQVVQQITGKIWWQKRTMSGQSTDERPPEWQEVDLYRESVQPLDIKVDFDHGFRALLNEDRMLVFEKFRVYGRRGKAQMEVLAQHVFTKYRVVTFSIDQDLLLFLDEAGQLRAMDMALVKMTAFSAPVPIFKVAELPIELRSQLGSAKPIKIQTIHRENMPPGTISFKDDAIYPWELKRNSDPRLYAGDFILEEKDGLLWGWYDRQQIWAKLALAEMVLAVEAFLVSPVDQQVSLRDFFEAIRQNPQIQDHLTLSGEDVDIGTRQLLARLPDSFIKQLFVFADNRNVMSKGDKAKISDHFYLSQWLSDFKRIRGDTNELEIGQPSSEDKWRQPRRNISEDRRQALEGGAASPNYHGWHQALKKLLGVRQYLHRENIRRVAYVGTAMSMAGGIAWGTAQADFFSEHYGPYFLPWLLHVINMAADIIIPAPLQNLDFQLKGSPYWLPLTVHLLAFLSFPVALKAMGQFLGAKRGWDFMKALTTAGMRLEAIFNYPLVHVFAKVTLQKRLLWAMNNGISPWTRIDPDSEIGRALGLSKPILPVLTGVKEIFGKTSNTISQTKLDAAKLLIERQRRRDLAAWILANAVVSESTHVDLATLKIMFERGQVIISPGEMRSPAFLRKWQTTATQLDTVLKGFERLGLEDLSRISPQDLSHYYELAKSQAKMLQSQPGLSDLLWQARVRWSRVVRRTPQRVSQFAWKESRFLSTGEASPFVSREHWHQLKNDLRFSTLLMGGWGARADFDRPERLAADPNGPLMTNPTHFSDLFEQMFIYMVPAAASMALIYQSDREEHLQEARHLDPRYAPLEVLQAKLFEQREDRFGQALVDWLKEGLNLPKAAYGEVFWKGIVKQFRTVQGYYLRGSLIRVFVGHQPLDQALIAISYTWLAAKLAFGWPWVLVNRTDQLYSQHLAENQAKVEQSRLALLQALRSSDSEGVHLAVDSLRDLYKTRAQEPLLDFVREVESSLGVGVDRLALGARFIGKQVEPIAQLYAAWQSGSQQSILTAYEELVRTSTLPQSEVSSVRSEGIEKSAQHLLSLSDRYSPLPTSFNRGVHRVVLVSAAALATYWASFMFADSYHLDMSELKSKLVDSLIYVPMTFFAIIAGDRTLRNHWGRRWGLVFASWMTIASWYNESQVWMEQSQTLPGSLKRWSRGGIWSIERGKGGSERPPILLQCSAVF